MSYINTGTDSINDGGGPIVPGVINEKSTVATLSRHIYSSTENVEDLEMNTIQYIGETPSASSCKSAAVVSSTTAAHTSTTSHRENTKVCKSFEIIIIL